MNTRERLVEATRASVRDVGLPATTAREITRRAEANLAAIPYHFGTKDALVAEALVAEARELVAPVLDALAGDDPPLHRLAAAVTTLNELFDAHRGAVPTYLTAVAMTPHLEPVRDELGRLLGEVRGSLTTTLATLRADGQVPAWVDPEAMAGLIVAVVNGVLVGAQTDPAGPDHRAVAAQFMLLLTQVSAGVGGASDA
jgi:AcrR family transcriptional regulator